MSEAKEKAILALRELLTSDTDVTDVIDSNGNFIMKNFETKCICCGNVLGNTEQDGFHPRYVTCPNCSYIQYVPNCTRIPPFWIYKIVDDKGKDILDFKGNCRRFEGKNQAEEYIAFCNMTEKWMPVKVEWIEGFVF